MTTYLDETLKRIQTHPGVVGSIVMTSDGCIIKTTLDNETAKRYSYLISDVCDRMRNMTREMEPGNDLNLVRLQSKRNEILIVPDKDYVLVTIKTRTE